MFSVWFFVYFFILKLYASILQDYLKFEKSSGDPARVQILYERAITDFPVSSDLWLDYTRYLDRTLKVFLFSSLYFLYYSNCNPSSSFSFHILQVGRTVSNVYSRAIKNCPWVGELWVRYLLSLERNRASEKEIAAVCIKYST